MHTLLTLLLNRFFFCYDCMLATMLNHGLPTWLDMIFKKSHFWNFVYKMEFKDLHNKLYHTICCLRSCTGSCVSCMAPGLMPSPLTPPQVIDANGWWYLGYAVGVRGSLFWNFNCLEGPIFFLTTETGLIFLDRSRTGMRTPVQPIQQHRPLLRFKML